MTDQWLKSFILAADCGSFSKAARASFISTTAFVQQMNLFEKELGFAVFERSSRGLRLTDAGEDFYQTVKQLLSDYEYGIEKAAAIAQNYKMILRFGFEPYQFPYRWISVLNDFQLDNNNIEVQMKAVSLQEQIPAIRNNIIDACIMGKPKEEYIGDLRYMDLYEDTYSFCMRKDHPLAGRKILSTDDVKQYEIICGSYPFMEQSFEEGLTGAGTLKSVNADYDISTRFDLLSGEEMFVIHGCWRDTFSSFYEVIDTDISAGEVGIVYHKKHETEVKTLYHFLFKKEYAGIFGR